MKPRIFLYPYAGPGGKNYLKQRGTIADLEKHGISLSENMKLTFRCDDADDNGVADDLLFDGTVHFDTEQERWYVIVDEASYRHSSEEQE